MHVFALPTLQRDALAQINGPKITIRILMTATYKPAVSFTNGIPTFDTNWHTLQVDLSSRFVGDVKISGSKPIFPDGDGYARTQMQIPLANPDGYIAVTQTGSKIRGTDIEQGTIYVDAFIEGVTQPVSIFRGTIIGPPKEARGLTTFTIYGTEWDALRIPVLYEDYANIAGGQEYELFNGIPKASHRRVDTLSGGHFCVYNGLLKWDAQGELAPRYTTSNATQVNLRKIRIENKAKPGKYSIEFSDGRNFTLTYPDNSIYRGNTRADLISPKITILSSYWTGTDGKGVKIEMGIGPCMKGNPITIARNFIEKALLNNWGFAPANTMQVKMDTAAWDEAEARFQTYTIYLSETNDDNSVWNQKRGENNMPINCMSLAQRALDHVGCFLQMRRDGLISLVTPFLDGRDVWDLTDQNAITDLTIETGDKFNYLTLQYGEDKGTYSATAEADLRSDPSGIVTEKVVSAPYYKAGTSAIRAKWLLQTYVRRYAVRQVSIIIKTIPQMGLPMLCGDVVRVISATQPAVSLVCEIESFTIDPRGECSFSLVPVQQWEGDPFVLCVARLDLERMW